MQAAKLSITPRWHRRLIWRIDISISNSTHSKDRGAEVEKIYFCVSRISIILASSGSGSDGRAEVEKFPYLRLEPGSQLQPATAAPCWSLVMWYNTGSSAQYGQALGGRNYHHTCCATKSMIQCQSRDIASVTWFSLQHGLGLELSLAVAALEQTLEIKW